MKDKVALHDIIGSLPAVDIIEDPFERDIAVLIPALVEVERLLLPYPARRIRDSFWLTLAGKQVSRAQWLAYEREACRPVKIAMMFYGKAKAPFLRRVNTLYVNGVLRYYHAPQNARLNPDGVTVYSRRPDVVRCMETRQHYTAAWGEWKKERWTPQRDADRLWDKYGVVVEQFIPEMDESETRLRNRRDDVANGRY